MVFVSRGLELRLRNGPALSACILLVVVAHLMPHAASMATQISEDISMDSDVALLLGDCPSAEQHLLLNPANKAMLAPLVFHGILLAKWQDESRNLLIKLHVHKILKRGFSTNELLRAHNLTTGVEDPDRKRRSLHYSALQSELKETTEVVVALLRDDSTFVRQTQDGPCPITLESMQAASLVTSGRYLVYVAPLWGHWAARLPRANFSAVALPDPFSRRASRTIHKSLCDNCVLKAATVRFRRQRVTLKPFQRLRLRCTLRGNPLPYVSWTKDGVPIRSDVSSGRVMIRHKRRRSRLEVSSVRTSDSGEYTCTASNVISPHRASASVQVTVREMVLETRHSPWNRPSENEQTNNESSKAMLPSGPPCPLESYCLNGATCILLVAINEPSCVCPDGFQGPRCENKLVQLRPPHDAANNLRQVGLPGMLWQAEEYKVRSLENHPLWRRLHQQSHKSGSASPR